MSLTAVQQKAVVAEGNVLLMAGAGTGKTRTLVERCLNFLLDAKTPCDISEILVVTFTEAAAAEMRQRLRTRLQERADASSHETRAAHQLALFETAHIGTLHSFCLDLARRHFYLLELDPQFSVMSEEESRLLASEQLDALFADMYSAKTALAQWVRDLIATHGDGSDKSIRALVHRLHDYAQTLPDPEGWKTEQIRLFSEKEPALWSGWLNLGLLAFKREWLPALQDLATANGMAQQCLANLERMPDFSSSNIVDGACLSEGARTDEVRHDANPHVSADARSNFLETACSIFDTLCSTPNACPKGKKGAWLDPLKEFFSDAQFLCSILPRQDGKDPLAEDWSWVSAQMRTLLELSSEFTERFSKAKRDLALADFHDLEQFALQLLWNNQANAPTAIAHQWRKQFQHVLVDEYQDINAAQDQILKALSRDGSDSNRFLVGDLKQSIYRFRLAAPRIFQSYMREWRDGSGTVLPLNENFRSREGVLDFINSVFEMLMVEQVGGIKYDEDARLRFGAPDKRKHLSMNGLLSTALSSGGGKGKRRHSIGIDSAGKTKEPVTGPRVEFHIRIKTKPGSANGDPAEADESVADLEEAAKEARLVALQLKELKESQHPIWDEDLEQFRPVDWKDMAILLRARSGKTEFYVREFSRLQIPLAAARGDFFKSTEISDVLSLLAILDNPLQDLPVLAVLRSPLVGLSLEELAEVRLAAQGPFWMALGKWQARKSSAHPANARTRSSRREEALSGCFASDSTNMEPPYVGCYVDDGSLPRKIGRFMERYSRWRRLSRQLSLSSCLEEILAETRYPEWLLTQSRGQERFANLQGLINLARKFDRFQKQGLLRFLLFVEAQKSAEADPPVPTVIDENAVRLMSIHQSKGLEFPVVVLPDTAKAFNLKDLKADIILDEVYGICPMIKPPNSSKRYPSLPYWLGRKRQRTELLGEELRLLYVAMTRARDTLMITASVSEKQLERIWRGPDGAKERNIAGARCLLDWLGLWLAREAGAMGSESRSGECPLARWTIHDDAALAETGIVEEDRKTSPLPEFLLDSSRLKEIETKLSWNYPFSDAVRQPAKASVSTLRRAASTDSDEEAQVFKFRTPATRLSAAKALDAGTVMHTFMQNISLRSVGSDAAIRSETDRMVREGLISQKDAALIDLKKAATFWASALGQAVLAKDVDAHRELPFTAKFRIDEINDLFGTAASRDESDEFIVVQGVADLVLMRADALQVIDFKTDNVSGKALVERARQYEMQLRLYALALGRIYKRPVSGCWLYFLRAGEAVSVK